MKTGLFQRLGAGLPASAILGSNTSSISLTKLAAAAGKGLKGDEAVKSSERVVG